MAINREEEQKLIQRVQAGDGKAFEELYYSFYESVDKWAHKYIPIQEDREELVQDTFVMAWEHIDRFDFNYRFSSWIYKILENNCLKHIKSKKRNKLVEMIEAENFEGNTFGAPDEEITYKDFYEKLYDCMQEIPRKYRIVLGMRYRWEMPSKDMAEFFNVTPATINNRLRKGRELLKKKWKNKNR